jgi:preprotein translocase subunit SecD
MSQRVVRFIGILALGFAAVWIALPTNERLYIPGLVNRDISTQLGLDLVGGVQALLEADLPEGTDIPATSLETVRTIIESRANGLLGVGEASVQIAGDRRIVVELPGATNPETALNVLGETGQLEFVDMSQISAQQAASLTGFQIETDYPQPPESPTGPVFHTIMTGDHLSEVGVARDQLNQFEVTFQLDPEGADIFRDFTENNTGRFLAIVLDKTVISIPRINQPITSGRGSISGNFDAQSANDLAIQLDYGSLPIPLKVTESRTVGPSLGQDSLQKSLVAGLIGMGMVVVFMALYYRLPGLLADVALLLYVSLTFAIFKLIPVTLTLPGIAGFVLSIGVAVDANILIFERLKEELKQGLRLKLAIERAWERAWPSIRDSNLSTLITCAILFWFGSAFGASIVKGFAVTLAIGVLVSMFTAIFVTHNLLHMWLDNIKVADHLRLLGVSRAEVKSARVR